MDFDIIILGGGPGGYIAAERAAHNGKKVALIEKEFLGGTCLNWGCVPTKTLLASSKVFYQATHSSAFGVTVSGAKFDPQVAHDRKEKIVTSLRSGIAGLMKKFKIEVINGEGVLNSKNSVKVGDKEYSATNIIIATGSSSARPPIPGMELDNVYDSNRILNHREIPAAMAIIGGGVIGLEFACYYGSLGSKVTVIEMLPEVCPGIDVDIAKTLRQELQHKNVNVILGAKVTKISKTGVTYSLADQDQSVDAELVLVATGRVPNIKNIGLEQVGVDFDRAGIKVDDHCRTNIPNIYAIGDCNGKIQLAHVASRQGEVAVNSICGKSDKMRYNAIPAVVYTSPEVACVGLTEAQAAEKGLAVKTAKLPLSISGRFLAENDNPRGLVKVVTEKDSGKLLGVHMLGNLTSETIWGAAALIEAEFRADEIKEIVFPHPTVGEIIKDSMFS